MSCSATQITKSRDLANVSDALPTLSTAAKAAVGAGRYTSGLGDKRVPGVEADQVDDQRVGASA